MATQSMSGQGGVYSVDWEVVKRVCRSHVRWQSIMDHYVITEESHLLGPDIRWIEVDWKLVSADVEQKSGREYQSVVTAAQQSIDRAAESVRAMVDETQHYRNEFQKEQRACSAMSMQNVEKSVSRAGYAVTGLTWVRDFSADFVLIGASALTGGAAVGAIGAGALLKGVYKGEDTALKGPYRWNDAKVISTALFTASTELFFAIVPLKLKALGGVREVVGKLVLAKAKAGMEIAKSVIDGKTVAEGLVAAPLKQYDPAFLTAAREWMKNTDPKMRLIAVPVATTLKFLRDQGVKQLQKQVLPKPLSVGRPVPHGSPSTGSPVHPQVDPSVIDAATFDGCSVEDMGICKQ